MHYYTSNIPSKIFYAVYGAENLKINRVTSTKANLKNYYSALFSRMVNQGGNVNTIFNNLSKAFCRNFETFSRLFTTSLEFVESICV